MNVVYTRHARERMVGRGVSDNEVEEALRKGAKSLQKPDKILFYYQYFCVVAKKRGDTYYIITVKPR